MASNTTTASFIYKRKYAGRRPGEMATRMHPVLQLINRKPGFNGHDTNGTFYYAVRRANPQGVSGSFANAQATASGSAPGGASAGDQFAMDRIIKYGVIRLDGPSLAAAEGNDGAFLNLVTMESEGVHTEMGDTYAFEAHRDGSGNRGQRASISTNTITFTVPDNARNFKEGMVVVASANADGSSPRVGNTYVTAVDEDAGQITVNNAADITSFANNDYLFRQGDNANAVDGFEAHIPLGAPGTFRGVDRSVNPTRLAGRRVDNVAASIEENAGLTAIKIAQTGLKATHCLLNPIKFWEVVRRLDAKVEFQGAGGKAGYGFETFDIHTPAGTLKCVSDPDAPTNRGRVICQPEFVWMHLKNWIHQINDDKNGFFLRVGDGDTIEGRLRGMGNILCWKPGANGTFNISA